jgi:hypothetical protein
MKSMLKHGAKAPVALACVGATSALTTLSVLPGWNQLGNGYHAQIDVVAQTTKWAFYAPSLTGQTMVDYAVSKGYDVLSRVEAGEGFWVNSKQAKEVSMPMGANVTSSTFSQAGTRPLGVGWSLIATGDSPTPTGFNNALSLTPPVPGPLLLNVTSIWAWDTTTPGWYFWAPSLVNAGSLSNYSTTKGYLDFTVISNTPMGSLSPYTGAWVNKP